MRKNFIKIKILGFFLIAGAVPAMAQTIVTDSLQPEKKTAEPAPEVVVVGYGSIKKKDATGSVESLKADSFNKGVATSPEQLLQGKSAGVQVTSASGEPGGASSVNIRGINSIRSGTGPLYVVDGVALSSGEVSPSTSDIGLGSQDSRNPMNFINPNDIASMDILKDASATAIYGSRGANGVIIITTKKGKKGRGQLSFDMSSSWSKIAHDYDVLSADAFRNNTDAQYDFGSNVNAWDDILQTGTTNQYNLSYGGGSENGNYRFSLGYLNQEGIVKNTGIKKYNIGYNLNQNFFDNKLKLESSMNIAIIHDDATAISSNIGAEGDLIISALKWNPTLSYYNADGSYLQISDNQRNPQDLLAHYTDYTNTLRLVGNIAGTYRIIKGLDYKINLGTDYATSERGVAMSGDIGVKNAHGTYDSATETYTGANGVANIRNSTKYNYLIEHTLTYNKRFTDNLDFAALLGYSFQEFRNHGQSTVVENYGNNKNQNDYLSNIYAGTVQNTSGQGLFAQSSYDDPTVKLQSYFARATFTYDGKYIVNAIFRRDGSSKFGADNKYGNFPGVSVAWKINKEDFAPKMFSDLKLRAGWGVTGNQDFPSGSAITRYQSLFGVYRPVNYGNDNLKWETTTQYNAGIDFGVLNSKLTGTIDVYQKITKDLLNLKYQFQRPTDTPYGWYNLENTRIKNTGVELGLNYKIIDNTDLSWSVGGNIAFNSTNISGLEADGYPQETGMTTGTISGPGLSGNLAQGHFDGYNLYQFNLLQFEGFDANGIAKYTDVNNDGVINDSDKTLSGSALAKYSLGLNTNISYKNWDLGISGYGKYGGRIYDNTENALFVRSSLSNGNNVAGFVLDNGEALTGNSNAPSTRFLHSGDFFRLSNISLGYTLHGSENFLPIVNTIRIYANIQNVFTITPYKGFDPEVNSNKSYNGITSYGMDYAAYPKARSFQVGLNVNF